MSTNTIIKQQKIRPPKTNGLPLIGSLPTFLKNPFEFMLKAHLRYGDIYTLNLGPQKVIILNHPRQADHVFVKNFPNYIKGKSYDFARTVVPDALVVSTGEKWRRKRRIMQPHFHQKYIATLADIMIKAIDEALKPWHTAAMGGQPINLIPSFANITMNVLAKTMFGFGEGIGQGKTAELGDNIAFQIEYMLPMVLTQKIPPWIPIPGRNRFKRARDHVSTYIYNLIKRRQDGFDKGYDLLSMLIEMVDNETDERFQETELFNHTLELFIAGYESTSTTLTWIFYLLTQYPDVAKKVRFEVDTVLGDRLPMAVDLQNLIYTKQVIQESMRLYPHSTWLFRDVVEDDEIEGYHIPKGATVVPFIYAIQRHPQVWTNPDQFDPDRFRPDRLTKAQRSGWMPFLSGQRICIGKEFAMMEMQFVIAMVMQQYTLSLLPGTIVKLQRNLAVKPSGKMPAVLTERNKYPFT